MSTVEKSKSGAVVFECVSPILRVANLEASAAYYVDVLGFKVDWMEPGIMVSVSRGGKGLLLCEGDQGNPGGWVWIGVSDADQLFQEYTAAGAKIRQPPTNYPWACEMQVLDPDGNVLRMGSESKPDQPIGTWRDMAGQVWAKLENGKWQKAG
jgi:predicted enzyme related to lactoylglutathione lyase